MSLIDEPNEVLYRKIHSSNQFDERNNKITSAAFKTSTGCSVDKLANRDEIDIVKYYENKWKQPKEMKAIVKITVQECLDIPTYPVNKPTCDNRFHAEIHDSEYQIEISRRKARLLAKKAKIVRLY